MDKDLEFFKEECGVELVSTPPFSYYKLVKNGKVIHSASVFNSKNKREVVIDCAEEWLNKWYKTNK